MKFQLILSAFSKDYRENARKAAGFINRAGIGFSDGMTILLAGPESPAAERLASAASTEKVEILRFPRWRAETALSALAERLDFACPVIFAPGQAGEELAVRLAARKNGTSLTGALDADFSGKDLVCRKRIYADHIVGTWRLKKAPFFLSIDRGIAEEEIPVTSHDVSEVMVQSEDPIRAKDTVKIPEQDIGDLKNADRVLAVGRGIRSSANAKLAETISETLGMDLGASRPVCMNAWLPMDRLIGVSGTLISPKLCLVAAASGSPAFYAGIEGTRTIVAINRDEDAPIMKKADAYVVGDWKQVLEALAKRMEKEKG